MEVAQLLMPAIAIVISVVALHYSRKSWLDANRPIITLKVSSQGMGGNVATPLSLIVENTGNRPAIDIQIKWYEDEYVTAFNAPEDNERRSQFQKTYDDGVPIPVLANGRSVSTSFGFIGDERHPSLNEAPTWKADSRFRMNVTYKDLDGRLYTHLNPLIMADDHGFGGGVWKEK